MANQTYVHGEPQEQPIGELFTETVVGFVQARKKVAQIGPPKQTVETLMQNVHVAQTSLKRGFQAQPTPWKGR